MKKLNCILILHLCALSTTVSAEYEKSGFSRSNELIQPCLPHDSCGGRCVKDSFSPTTYVNVTLGHFNCYCDPDCKTFGDCCWDYHDQCVSLSHPQPKSKQSVSAETLSEDLDFTLSPRDSSFECVVVDQFSKGAYWMVNKCAGNWTNDEIRDKCVQTNNVEFETYLPVLGNTGWTYRNIFCAQCNYVTDFAYWAISAKCVRSAPEEVLYGEPEMLSYYLNHFCSIEVQQDMFYKTNSKFINSTSNIRQLLAWKKSLRSCEKNMIRSCPDNFDNDEVSQLCENYQSVVLIEDREDSSKMLVFKNLVCAFCHGYFTGKNQPRTVEPINSKYETTEFSCPLWMLTQYYDTAYWLLDANKLSLKLLPTFSRNYKTSSWSPPSFSILMRFQDNGQSEIIYNDGSNSVPVPTHELCESGEIYDPFFGTCRLVFCANDMVYENGMCVHDSDHQHDSISSMPVAATVTVSIVFPSSLTFNSTNDVTANDVGAFIIGIFEEALNISAENITVINESVSTTTNFTNEKQHSPEDSNNDGTISVSVSFVVLGMDNYTNDDAMKIIHYINQAVSFEKLMLEVDMYSVLVVETADPPELLVCVEGANKIEYNSSEYRIDTFDDKKMLYINTTDSYYLENEFQLLDWIVTFSENGIEYGFLQESRVLVCVGNDSAPTPKPCLIYLPLNTSEFVVLENGSLWMIERNVTVPPDEYIPFGETFAVCLDGYTPPPPVQPEPPSVDSTDLIISWVTFVLTIFSLVSLGFTFFTYCLFRELRSIAGLNIMNLTVALFAALLTFSVGASWTNSPPACTAITILLHYLFLATFFWNNVMAFDVWLTFGKGIKQTFRRSLLNQSTTVGRAAQVRRLVLKYMAYAWCMPGLLVAICSVLEFGFPQVHFGYRYDPTLSVCWISNSLSNLLAFGVPLGLILIFNTIFFTLSIIAIRRISAKKRRHSSTASAINRRKSSVQQPFSPKVKVTDPNNDNVFTFPEPSKNRQTTKNNDSPKQMGKNSRQYRQSTASNMSYKMSMGMARVNVLLYIKMSTVMGFTWAIGFASAIFVEIAALRYIFEISVPLQGIFILIAFICKRRIFELYKDLIRSRRQKNGKEKSKQKKRVVNLPEIREEHGATPIPKDQEGSALPTGVYPPVSNERQRSRFDSSSSCESMNSRDKWLCSPLPVDRRISDQIFKDMQECINQTYESSTPSQSRSSSESANDDYL